MHMAAADPLDLWVATDDLGKIVAAAEAHAIHGCDPGPERRVVHQDQCRPIGCCRQRIVDPLQPVAAQFSTGFTRYEGVKPDNAQWEFVGDVVQKSPDGEDNHHR